MPFSSGLVDKVVKRTCLRPRPQPLLVQRSEQLIGPVQVWMVPGQAEIISGKLSVASR